LLRPRLCSPAPARARANQLANDSRQWTSCDGASGAEISGALLSSAARLQNQWGEEGSDYGHSPANAPAPPPAPAPISNPRLADAVRKLLATMDCSNPAPKSPAPPPVTPPAPPPGDANDKTQAVSRQPQPNTDR
jgi:hypothetical protein